ncbi:MAG: DUF3291 domain-containing protein [Bryobacteraceae bacterium]|nr:DUF3291 domain-containing protein [Bryobacteraceae bacterium]
MFVSITRLRLRSLLFLPAFLLLNQRCLKQLRSSPGFVRGGELLDKGLTFWTVTLWTSEREMKSFRGADAHSEAMKLLPEWCNEAAIAHWQQDESDLPTWPEAHRKLNETGRLSRVNRPGQNHTARRFREPSSASWRASSFTAS